MKKLILTGILGTILLSGCVVAREYEVPPPPAERVEVIGVAPYPDAIWVRGNWYWGPRHHRYYWREGYWQRHHYR